ncbi:hypothetical protein N9112_01970 [bacterium]|nr:hypothetical protein [bacterium]
MKIAHIINPVLLDSKSDLHIAQPVTFSSMLKAAEFARETVDVELFSTCYEEDLPIVPAEFTQTKLLPRSILDVGTFKLQRKLPLLKDILQNLFEASDADYLIYTNVDIALMPHFYTSIAELIKREKFDAIIVNRRTISYEYTDEKELSLMYMQAGKPHKGYDCFVFSREIYEKLDLGNIAIGVSFIGLVFMLNLYKLANNFCFLDEAHLTFHLGDDQAGKNPKYSDYLTHNENEAYACISRIEEKYGKFDSSTPSWSYKAIRRVKNVIKSEKILMSRWIFRKI